MNPTSPSPRQREVLLKFGFNPKDFNCDSAGRLIMMIQNNGWKTEGLNIKQKPENKQNESQRTN